MSRRNVSAAENWQKPKTLNPTLRLCQQFLSKTRCRHGAELLLPVRRLRVCAQEQTEVTPTTPLCLCLHPRPWYLLLQGNLLCREPPRSVPPETTPCGTFCPCRRSVDGSKMCFSVSNIYLFDLGLHTLNENVNHFCGLLYTLVRAK